MAPVLRSHRLSPTGTGSNSPAGRAALRSPSPPPSRRKRPATPGKPKRGAPPPPPRRRAAPRLLLALLFLALLFRAAFVLGTAYVQSIMAWFEPGEPLAVSPAALATHASLFVADLHCDATWTGRRALRAQWESERERGVVAAVLRAPRRGQGPVEARPPERLRPLALRALPRGRAPHDRGQRRAAGARGAGGGCPLHPSQPTTTD